MKNKHLQIRNSTAEFLIFTSQAGENGIEVRFQNETIWLSQKMIAVLFDCSTDNVSLHLKNIFKTKELDEKSVAEDFSVTASDGKNYKTKHYNLDAIIAIGYRVNSQRATQFRQWATSVLRDFAIRWAGKLNAFLQFNEKEILGNAGKVTQAIAKAFAESEFEKYRIVQDKLFESDFDKAVKKLSLPAKSGKNKK